MQPAMKISLVRLAEALSPGSTRQNSVLLILCMTCTGRRNPVTHPAGSERLGQEQPLKRTAPAGYGLICLDTHEPSLLQSWRAERCVSLSYVSCVRWGLCNVAITLLVLLFRTFAKGMKRPPNSLSVHMTSTLGPDLPRASATSWRITYTM